MAMRDIRKLAHRMMDELDDEEVSEIIEKMHHLKNGQNKGANVEAFPVEEPTNGELRAIKNARSEFQNGEFLNHKDVFGEEDYV